MLIKHPKYEEYPSTKKTAARNEFNSASWHALTQERKDQYNDTAAELRFQAEYISDPKKRAIVAARRIRAIRHQLTMLHMTCRQGNEYKINVRRGYVTVGGG